MKIKYLGIIFLLTIVLSASCAFSFGIFQQTNLEVVSDINLANGDNFTIKLTCDGKGIANKQVNVTLINAGGGRNVQQLTTDENGEARFTLGGVADGEYSIECNFKGDWEYCDSQNDTKINVKTAVPEESTSSSSYSSNYYSKSSNSYYDPDYDPTRDASHRYATPDNPITVKQSDGYYRYYGPGHFDYYAGDNHMSGGYYKNHPKMY